MKKNKCLFLSFFIALGLIFMLSPTELVKAETQNFGNYIVSDSGNVVSVLDSNTGLTAYLDRETGILTDIDGQQSIIPMINLSEYYSEVPNPYLRMNIPGMKRGKWNYITTHTYNLGKAQSVQSLLLGIIGLLPTPASPFIGAASSALGIASLVNSNATVKVTQYYDPAKPSVIKETITTYKNGQYVGSTTYVRSIF